MSCVKNRIIFFILCFSYIGFNDFLFARVGEIIVLEAPMLKNNDKNSPVVGWVRKGQLVYIHTQHFLNATGPQDDFYLSMDRNGGSVYIPKEFVRLIYRNEKEFGDKNIESLKRDPTDYRLKGPLSPNYPLSSGKTNRAHFSIGTLSKNYRAYPYQKNILQQSQDLPIEIGGVFSQNTSFDQEDKIYFGAQFNFNSENNNLTLEDGFLSQESNYCFGLGPFFSYDIYKNNSLRFSYVGTILLRYHQRSIEISNLNSYEELRFYQAFSLEPRLGILWQKLNFFEDLNFVAGLFLNFPLGHTLENKRTSKNSRVLQFGEEDIIKKSFNTRVNLFLGLQTQFFEFR